MAEGSTSRSQISDKDSQAFIQLVQGLQQDATSVAATITQLQSRYADGQDLTYPDGISLLTLKNDVLLSYLHHLVLLSAHRLRAGSLALGTGAELVQRLVRLRLVLEKARPLESRLRYQVDKLLRAVEDEDRDRALGRAPVGAEEAGADDGNAEIDPLAFRPNPSALASTSNSRAQAAGSDGDASDDDRGGKTGVYRPPKLVPVAYNEETARSRSKRGRDSSPIRGGRSSALLADLTAGLSSNPYEASSAGIGAARGGGSTRARALERMEQYEEDNFTRLVMSKKDAKRRRRDEEDVELGGAGLSSGKRAGRVGGGMEEEFGDLLRSAESGGGRKSRKASHAADAYNSLRKNAKRPSAFERAREGGASRGGDAGAGFEPGPAPRKKGRFEAAVKGMRRKGNK